ncbi:RNA polymerase factor sigma-54 [Polycladidibacter hongkongensis]|uniref:RNA polymerase factor sigma-54 n=1 Tax=Polycladidibacter hongkongensis TaxID=1647556 RepID=UPI00082F4B3B|nr:RNA polymerase factor sigma-54 [Pseudovibrio hongkongensis]
MVLAPKLVVKQSQQLALTPQLMQSIKLLQFSSLDLSAYVEGELERNPFLERDDGEQSSAQADASSRNDASEHGEDGFDRDLVMSQMETSQEGLASQLDADLSSVFTEERSQEQLEARSASKEEQWQLPSHGITGTESDYNLEAFVASNATLADYVMEQAALALPEPVDQMIAQHLIGFLEVTGYLQFDEIEVAELLGTSPAHVLQVLAVLQSLEPSGVCARSLKECLSIQLREKDRFDPAMQALVENIELLAKHKLAKLQQLCGVDQDDLADMVREVRDLNPKPGNAFGGEPVQAIVPDAVVKEAPDGGWQVELNTDALPKVLVNQTYYSTLNSSSHDRKDAAFFTDSIQTANWLVKALEQRAHTILKVATEIVRQQDGFFAKGVQHLRPLNLKAVAEAIEMHESTVSRVTSNKYVATPRGIFELKYFFTSAIASSEGGEAHSAEAVRHKIKTLIDAEDPKKILSDDALVKALKLEGMDIARRTVAKYREAMNIPSSVQRRRVKNSALTN